MAWSSILSALICLAGANFKQARQVVSSLDSISASGLHIFADPFYIHLGGIIDSNSSMGPEIAHRTSSVRALFNPVRSHITGKANLTTDQHATVIDVLALASLCQIAYLVWHE